MPEYLSPGIYIEEIFNQPVTIKSVATAIPVFIGYTQKARLMETGDLLNVPFRIASVDEYEYYFGIADFEKGIEITFEIDDDNVVAVGTINQNTSSHYLMYYWLQLFFINGGGACYIASVGTYSHDGVIKPGDLTTGLEAAKNIDEITLLLFPDSVNVESYQDYYSIYEKAMRQCEELQDRFTILTVFHSDDDISAWKSDAALLRSSLDLDAKYLQYAAAYFPRLYTSIPFNTKDELVKIVSNGAGDLPGTLAELKLVNEGYYELGVNAIRQIEMRLPASPAVAGVYANTDKIKGVWKAPADVNIDAAIRPEYVLTQQEQEELNGEQSKGKYINVVRTFTGRGPAIIWGARTLADNDNEWRYISVRRYFNMVGESCKEATESFIFEPNNANTWSRVKMIIENYLVQQWQAGALMGTKAEQAFFVHVGLGTTMTQNDIENGDLIVEIGMAVMRPAEFIILRLSQKMIEAYD